MFSRTLLPRTRNLNLRTVLLVIVACFVAYRFLGVGAKSSEKGSGILTRDITLNRDEYGKKNVHIVVIQADLKQSRQYALPQATLRCYSAFHNYTLAAINFAEHVEYAEKCPGEIFVFRRHCALSHYMENHPEAEWLLFLDADIGVVNPNHLIEEYLKHESDLTFYTRAFNYEVMAGVYIVKNNNFSRQFLMKWSRYEVLQPKAVPGSDNGAIHKVLLDEFASKASKSEASVCQHLWEKSKKITDIFVFESCVRSILGFRSRLESAEGSATILFNHGDYLARDGWMSGNAWSDQDFLFHGWQEKRRNRLHVFAGWKSPFAVERFPTDKCLEKDAGKFWAYHENMYRTGDHVPNILTDLTNAGYIEHLRRLEEVAKQRGMELDIQGLRCVAVIYVVLFHLWPRTFKNGYLGVDIFFVISGYLMHHILSSKELSSHAVAKFYFRRIRRIAPPYIVLLTLTVVAANVVFSILEFSKVLDELLAAATFTSNIFKLPAQGYFAINNEYPLFLHTWSLSVEFQFYLIVPFIYLVYCRLRAIQRHVAIGFLVCLAALSFAYQVANGSRSTNIAHMSLLSRIWQFLFGFLANALKSTDKMETYAELPTDELGAAPSAISRKKEDHSQRVVKTILAVTLPFREKGAPSAIRHQKEDQSQRIIKTILAITLLYQLLYPLTHLVWLNRLICISTAAAFICLKSGSWLEQRSLVFVGDISYSLYLIHWPVIIFWKFMGLWEVTGPTVQDGLIILQGSMFLSYLFETGFKKLLASVDGWIRLTKLLLLLNILLISSAAVMYLRVPESSRDKVNGSSSGLNMTVMDQTLQFYENRHKMSLNLSRDKGTGTKEIVIIGNSFARDLFYGVWPLMKHNFKRLSMYCLSCAIPYAIDKQTGQRRHDFIGLIKRWDRPIDILIVRHS
ncbi:unnamed protein product [Bursaphelenchus xylophilus]|uniref:(pine wood nematode) hypothetical protein n=1 Tax=Bursaphelenchus xylophilus TaxID=6326 RepID=A0A7I8WM87_BURXY|nr:unnamed protein product [Bursaphelenchus xylophilus]CAG9104376.1 unnamed protein product [Bursaphelenchus xylophilus]